MYKFAINALLSFCSVAYPLLWLGQTYVVELSVWLPYFPFVLAPLWFAKAVQAVGFYRFFALFMALLLLSAGLTQSLRAMYWYPIAINSLMLVLFGGSLWAKRTMVERFARLQEPDLPPQAVAYTRNVTKVWCGVFMLNIVVSSALVLLDELALWAWYAGGFSYLIMAGVMGLEWLIRPKYKNRENIK